MLGSSDRPSAVLRGAFVETASLGVQGSLSLAPVLKLEGAQLDGGDLLLRANLSSDRRSLTALTPRSEMPLSAGDHPLQLSLNGQFTEPKRRDLVSSRPCWIAAPMQVLTTLDELLGFLQLHAAGHTCLCWAQ